MASTDSIDKLTGLPSLEAGRGIVNGSIGHNGRVALLLCDLDRFRVFNNQFGHAAGDRKLRRLARTLKEIAAPFPVFRFGGDVFCVVVQERSLEEVRHIAARLLEAQTPVTVPVEGDGDVETLTLSIGFALFPFHAFDAQSLWEAADVALLKVKRGGRLADGTRYTGRNRAMTWGDFVDEFPHQSKRFLNPDFVGPSV